MTTDAIARIRRFNRAVTLATGALDTSFLGLGRPLGAARVLWSIKPEGTDVATLRQALDLDSGHLSRILRRLESEGLLITEPAPGDRRHRIARLTPAGVTEVAEYDRLSDITAGDMLSRSRDAEAILSAMDLIANTLTRDRIEITPADPEAPDALACIAAYSALLVEKIPELSPADIPAPQAESALYRPPHGAFLLARADGTTLACVALKTAGPGTGEVKRLWVAPSARGMGLARRMMTAIEDQARTMGLTRLRLDTNENLAQAIALYRATGWAEAEPFTGFPATHWFAKPL